MVWEPSCHGSCPAPGQILHLRMAAFPRARATFLQNSWPRAPFQKCCCSTSFLLQNNPSHWLLRGGKTQSFSCVFTPASRFYFQDFDAQNVSPQTFAAKCQSWKYENHNVAVAAGFHSNLGWNSASWKFPAGKERLKFSHLPKPAGDFYDAEFHPRNR